MEIDRESDGARFSPRPNKSNNFCSVFGCNSRSRRDPDIRFHCFPSEKNNKHRRNCWANKLRIGKNISEHMRVCSLHFRRSDYFLPDTHSTKRYLKNNAVPSCNLPKSCVSQPLCLKTVVQTKERKNRTEGRARQLDKTTQNVLKEELEKQEEMTSIICNINTGNTVLLENNIPTIPTTVDVSTQVTSGDFKNQTLLMIINTDQKLSTLTGIPTHSLLDSLIECIQFSQLVTKRKQHLFSIKERVVMTFIKLKQNLSYSVLAIFFDCSITNCKRIILNTIDILSSVLKSMIPWPSKTEILSNMPQCFLKFSDTRIIVDCIEIPLMKPKKLSGSIITYSQYKSTYTAKFMTGITPGGIISFITPAYGGRVSDKFIFENSKLIDNLEDNDAIMTDKGFLIDNICTQRHIKLYRPPFLRAKKQLSQDEALLNVTIASARVHIERVNQRIKVFNIFQKFPTSLLPKLDALFLIICSIVNLSAPILADDKF